MDATNCDGKGDCQDGKPCSTHSLWYGLNEVLHTYLSAVNLQQLVDKHLSEQNKVEAAPVAVNKRGAKAAAVSV